MKKMIFAVAILIGLQTAVTAQSAKPAGSAQAGKPTEATAKPASASDSKKVSGAKKAAPKATAKTAKPASAASNQGGNGGAKPMPAKAAPKK